MEKDDDKYRDNIPCGSLAFDSILRIATAGIIWGLLTAPQDACRKGHTGAFKHYYVARSAGAMGLRCGMFAGIYSVTHCQLQAYRMKNDWLNSSIAGAVTGTLFAVQTAHRFRGVVGMAALVSAVTTAAELSTETWSPSR